MDDDLNAWLALGDELGIQIVSPVWLELSGAKVRFSALLPQFGGLAGMVVDSNWDAIEPHVQALDAAGYGYSCVGSDDLLAEMASTIEMLSDWGWSNASPKPHWLESDSPNEEPHSPSPRA